MVESDRIGRDRLRWSIAVGWLVGDGRERVGTRWHLDATSRETCRGRLASFPISCSATVPGRSDRLARVTHRGLGSRSGRRSRSGTDRSRGAGRTRGRADRPRPVPRSASPLWARSRVATSVSSIARRSARSRPRFTSSFVSDAPRPLVAFHAISPAVSPSRSTRPSRSAVMP